MQMRRRRDLFADEAGADQAGQSDAEDGERQAGGNLVDGQASVIIAKTSDSSVPAAIPQSAPRMIEPVSQAPPNPQAAPTIIMPSTPRLSTPDRSVTSSPVAASSSGVEAARIERMMASSQFHCTPAVTRK